MSDQIFQAAIIASILASTIRLATPLLLAALGELVTERSGVMNLGVEGIMLLSAFTSFMLTYVSGSIWLGVLAALVTGGLMALSDGLYGDNFEGRANRNRYGAQSARSRDLPFLAAG